MAPPRAAVRLPGARVLLRRRATRPCPKCPSPRHGGVTLQQQIRSNRLRSLIVDRRVRPAAPRHRGAHRPRLRHLVRDLRARLRGSCTASSRSCGRARWSRRLTHAQRAVPERAATAAAAARERLHRRRAARDARAPARRRRRAERVRRRAPAGDELRRRDDGPPARRCRSGSSRRCSPTRSSHIRHRDTYLMTIATDVRRRDRAASPTSGSAALAYGGGRREAEASSCSSLALVGLVLAPYAALMLRLSLSRRREFLADAGSAEILNDPEAMALALRRLELDPTTIRYADASTAHLWVESPTDRVDTTRAVDPARSRACSTRIRRSRRGSRRSRRQAGSRLARELPTDTPFAARDGPRTSAFARPRKGVESLSSRRRFGR